MNEDFVPIRNSKGEVVDHLYVGKDTEPGLASAVVELTEVLFAGGVLTPFLAFDLAKGVLVKHWPRVAN